jgi:hypothetical protein
VQFCPKTENKKKKTFFFAVLFESNSIHSSQMRFHWGKKCTVMYLTINIVERRRMKIWQQIRLEKNILKNIVIASEF